MAEHRPVPVFLSLEEAAECISVSVKTMRRWIAAGSLPACRCGKRAIGIKLEDLQAALTRPHPTQAELEVVLGHLAAAAVALPQAARQLRDILDEAKPDRALALGTLSDTEDPKSAVGTVRLHPAATHKATGDDLGTGGPAASHKNPVARTRRRQHHRPLAGSDATEPGTGMPS